MAACGNRRVSGPSRENAFAGRALSKRPTAAATSPPDPSARACAASRTHARPRSLPAEALQRDAVEEAVADRPVARAARAARAAPAPTLADLLGGAVRRDEYRQVAREARVEQIAGRDRVRGIRLDRRGPTPRLLGPGPPAQKRAIPRFTWTAALLGCAPRAA